MEEIVVADFTDSVLLVLNELRAAAEVKELQNAMGEAVTEHVHARSASYAIASAEESADEAAVKAAALASLQAFLADEANAAADEVLLAKSPHVTHCEATLNAGEITVKYQYKYLEIASQGPAIDGALVVQGVVLEEGYRPALCCVAFAGEEEVDINVGPWDFMFEAAEEGVDGFGKFTIPVQGLPEKEGSVRVRVLVSKLDERLTALYAGPGEEEVAAFLGAENIAAMKADAITALEFTVAARVGVGGDVTGAEAQLAGGTTSPSGASSQLVLTSLKLAIDQDECSALRAEGYELTCMHVNADGYATENEGLWPFYVMAKYGPAADGGVLAVEFVSVPKSAAPAEGEGEEEAKEGSQLPPAVEEKEGGGMVETFIQHDLAGADAAESIFLQVTTSAAGNAASSAFHRLTMLSAGTTGGAETETEAEKAGEAEGGESTEPVTVTVQSYLAGLSTPTQAFAALPNALAVALGFTASNAGLLLETVAPEADVAGTSLSAAEEEAAAQAEAAAEEEAVEEEAEGTAQGTPRGDDMSHMTGSDAGTDDYDQEMNEAQLADQLEDKLRELKFQHDELEAENTELQKKSIVFMARERAALQGQSQKAGAKEVTPEEDNEAATERTAEKEKVLLETLSGIVASRHKISQQTSDYDQLAHDLQTRLDDREYKANEISESFGQFKSEILAKAENTRTSKPLSKRLIKQFEVAQAKRDEDLERARLRNISMRTSLLRLERQLRSREQLAEGLHMIDFEQLKVENQTLYEKIEERTEELTKLNRKKTNTVQVLTHVREKLRFVEKTNVQLNKDLSVVENETMSRRGTLTGGKKARDSVRDDNKELKRKQGFASSSGLLVDYENRTRALGDAHALLKELQMKYDTVANQCAKDEEYVIAMQQGRSLPGSAMYSGVQTPSGLKAGGIGGTNMGGGTGYPTKSLPQTPYFPGAKPESDGAYPPLMG